MTSAAACELDPCHEPVSKPGQDRRISWPRDAVAQNMSAESEAALPESEYLALVSALAALGRALVRLYQQWPEAGGLILKLAFHAASAHSLFRGIEPRYFGLQTRTGGPKRIIDHAATQALSRIVLETYLTYFHVFQQPGDNDAERELRYSAWKLASMRAELEWRSAAGADLPTEWTRARDALRESLASNVVFLGLEAKARERILSGRWRCPRWSTIAEQAGLPTRVSRPLYNMLSESMHSGSYAAFKVVQADPEAQRGLAEADLFLMMMIMGKALHSHLDVLAIPRDFRAVIEYWAVSWSSDPKE